MGRLGVLMFFAISGFVIPSSLRGMRWEGFKIFAIRRFWRLYPPFWVVLTLSIACFPEHYGQLGWTRLTWDVVMLPSLARPEAWTHFWTLEVELIFYVLVAGLFLSFGRIGGWVTFFAYILIGGLAAPYFLIYPIFWNSLYPHLAVMFWGAACREILNTDISRFPLLNFNGKGRAVLIGLVTGPLISGGSILVYKGITMGPEWGASLRELGITLIVAILGFLFWVVVTRPVQVGWLSIAGRWTYSTYLLHTIVLWGAVNLTRFFGGMWLGKPMPVYAAAVLVPCFAVGAVAYRWIEQPSDKMGKRLVAKSVMAG